MWKRRVGGELGRSPPRRCSSSFRAIGVAARSRDLPQARLVPPPNTIRCQMERLCLSSRVERISFHSRRLRNRRRSDERRSIPALGCSQTCLPHTVRSTSARSRLVRREGLPKPKNPDQNSGRYPTTAGLKAQKRHFYQRQPLRVVATSQRRPTRRRSEPQIAGFLEESSQILSSQ